MEPLRLMAVHAHPDDESSKGAASMARYAAEAERTGRIAAAAQRSVRSAQSSGNSTTSSILRR